jgi:hypothetical protein
MARGAVRCSWLTRWCRPRWQATCQQLATLLQDLICVVFGHEGVATEAEVRRTVGATVRTCWDDVLLCLSLRRRS